jgi:hypothetical protein
MMTKSILWMAILVPAALAADKGKDNTRAWYQDGTCVEFYSESTGGTTPSSTSGSVIVDNTNTVHRIVTDGRGKVLFAYDVMARKVAGSKDTFVVQIRPTVRQSSFTFAPGDQLAISVYGSPAFSGSHMVRPDGAVSVNQIGEIHAEGLSPAQLADVLKEKLKPHIANPDVSVSVTSMARTLSAVRDFPAVKRGEAVMVDILQNPATGEKIYDVLRPSDDPPPTTAAKIADELVLGSFQISINGEQFAQDPGGIVTGAAARIYVPKHGAYFLSLEAASGFSELGHANREKLTFSLGDEYVEIVAKQNVLTKSTYRPLWVKHDPAFTAADAKNVEVMTADKVEWLMPKKR